MPIYEYRCEKGHTFDALQRMAEVPLSACETCGAPAQRVMHAPAVHFKGSGFYNTDYGTKKRQREKEASSSESGSSSGGDGAKRESSRSGSDSGSGSDSKGSDSKGSGDSGTSKKETAATSGS